MPNKDLKDLFIAIKNERVFILRFYNMRDRNDMLDHRQDALQTIREFEFENGLSKDIEKFLRHRIYQAARDTGLN